MLGKDGLPPREDFREAMPYTQALLSNGMAIGYHAKAAPPTVTMPRLKVYLVINFVFDAYCSLFLLCYHALLLLAGYGFRCDRGLLGCGFQF